MDKIDRLLDAMEHPDRYTQTEIEAMLRDPDVKEVFDLLDRTKSSLQPIIVPDIEAEWKKFETNRRISASALYTWLTRRFSRNAAASIAIGIASLTAVAAIVGVGIHHINHNQESTVSEETAMSVTVIGMSQPDTITSFEVKEDVASETVVLEDEPLDAMMSMIAAYYGVKVVFKDDSSKTLRFYFRWNQALTVEEVVDRLNNFQQIHMTLKDKTITID